MTDTKPAPDAAAPRVSRLGDGLYSSSNSSGSTSPAAQIAQDPSEEALLESYARFRSSPFDALREFGLHVKGTGWRSYDRIVGQEIFYSGFSDRMKNMVMSSPLLLAKIAELSKRRIDVEATEGLLRNGRQQADRQVEIEGQLKEVAEQWTDHMICKMESRRFIRGAYYLCTQLLTRAYHQGIHVSSDEVMRLRSVAEEAAKKNQSIIFLPCHRSHVDYVSLQLICYRLGLALPVVVAGDNLNFPVVGPFLQHAGAMWIRRSFGDDALYTALVQSYMDTMMQNGYNIECFVEGGRSRTGKLLQPKFGILSFLLDSVLSGRVKDAIVCPVSTQYDKVIEVDSYISELLGQPKPKESLANFLSSSSILSLKLGRVDVRFHKPWSLRAFIDEQTPRLRSSSTISDSPDTTLKRRLLTTMGYQVLAEINEASVIMPTALIGTVLLTLRSRGVGKAELVRRVDWLCDRVRSRGGQVAHFANLPTATVVERALEVLGPKLVGVIDGLPEDTYFAADRFQLSFYRNMTIHLFVSEALVCAAVDSRTRRGLGSDDQSIEYNELQDYVYFLSQLFRAEFIFPTTPFADNLEATVKGLVSDGVLETSGGSKGNTRRISLSSAERLRGRENFDFYCLLIHPFIESSWLGAVSLLMLTAPADEENAALAQEEWLGLKQVQAAAQLLGKTLYHQGDLSFFEAVNTETLRNSYARSEEEGIITVTRSKEGNTAPRVRIARDWVPDRDEQGRIVARGKLWELCERIGRGRREGENRRDEATVRSRVLGLVDLVGHDLWENARAGVAGVAAGDVAVKARRRRALQATARL